MLFRSAERARLGEAWSLLHERVELCRRQDAAAQAERQEALRLSKETRDSVKREAQEVMDQLEAAREALEEETASKRQEVAALEQNFITHSKTVESSLKELRERLDAREAQLTRREEEQAQELEKDQAAREAAESSRGPGGRGCRAAEDPRGPCGQERIHLRRS